MSLLRKISLIFLISVILLVAAVTALLTTSSGIRFLVNTATEFVPGLSIGDVDGNLKNLTLNQIRYEMDGVDVSAGQLKLGLDFSCFKQSGLCVEQLATDNVTVNVNTALIPSSSSESDSEPLTDLPAPLPIELRSLVLNNTKVNVDGIAISLDHFSSGATWRDKDVTLTPTLIKSLAISLPETEHDSTTVEVKNTPERPLGEMLDELFSKPLLESLPAVVIPVNVIVEEIVAEDLRLTTKDETVIIDSVIIKANSVASDIHIETLKINAPQGTAALIGKASLNDSWPVSLTFNSALNIPELRGEKIKLQLDGDLLGEVKLDANVSGPVSVQITAETSLVKPELPLLLTVESQKIQWPITGKADYRADNLRLRLTGKATDYVLSLRSDLSGADIPPASFTLDGKGNTQQFVLSRLRLLALEGKAELSGVADWSKAISWNTSLNIEGINTIKQWPEWPATLQGKVTTKGSVHGGSWQLEVPEINLTGNVKQQKLNVTGSVRGNAAGQWRIPNLLIELGKNRLDAQGELSNSWALDANINAPNLNDSLPGLRGTVNGQLQLRGTQKAPQLITQLTASGLRWQDLSVAKLSVNGNVIAAQQVSGDLNVSAEQLRQGDTRIRLITLTAKGDEKNHRLDFKAEGRPIAGNLTLSGQFDRKAEYWKGTLSQTQFSTPLGNWSLSGDLPLDYRNTTQKATIGIHCWLNQDAELCLPKAAQIGKSGQVDVQLKRFDLRILRRMLRDTDFNELGLKGVFTGDANINWQDNGQLPQGKLTLKGEGVEISEVVNSAKIPVAFDDIRINANMNNQNVKLDWMLKLTNNGHFSGNVDVADPQNSRRLSGNVIFDGLSLAFLKPLLAGNEKAEGMINGNLRLGGNSKAPQITGNLNLDHLVLTTQWSPVTVTQGDIGLSFNGTSSTLDGLIRTRRGELTIKGDADWRNLDAWRARITANGDRIRVEMPPTVQLDVSPDIAFEATPALLKLTGSVAIPWARITVEELPESAVGVSSDEVILNDDLQPVNAEKSEIPIVSDVMINIGPDVSMDAFGLNAVLSGALKMTQDNRGLGLHGEITIPGGSYRAYGQDLQIKSGRIIFAGPPDQPQLNIDAIRNPEATEDGVTAGLRITGFADKPSLEIYSDPAMSQEEALSYLFRGQGLDTENDDSAIMTSMLISLGVAQSGRLVGRIGETFGVQNLSLDTQGVGDNSQVVVSGYVLPRLQVKYGIGIFDSLATLTLRYRLMPRLYLEAVSGVDQALDVLYQFEF